MSRARSVFITLLVPGLLLLTACGGGPKCTGDLQPYKDKCLSQTAIEYVGCTEGRGISPTTEIDGSVGGTFRVVADASVKLAYKRSEQENTPVALEIVKNCLEIAKSNAKFSPSDRSAAGEYQSQVSQFEQDLLNKTPALTLSADSAKKGAQLTVSGTKFLPTEMVDISVHASLVKQVKADGNGAFSTVITVPQDAPPPNFSTTITATGKTSARSASAPFHTAP